MEVLQTIAEMRAWSRDRKARGRKIGFVPTMGFLHRGHRSLMAQVRPLADELVVSIYVNPLQFGPSEDLSRYPRDLEGDLAQCRSEGVDAVFAPQSLYPEGFATTVSLRGLPDRWDGASRPGHFDGVATVVARLFGIVGCDLACFGEKDWQQLQVIRRMTEDLALPVEVLAGELVRDDDGVALSSRNAYLSAEERLRARGLHQALAAMTEAARRGERRAQALLTSATHRLTLGEGDRLDYISVVDARTLEPLDEVRGEARAIIAAWIGKTRLIDNMGIPA